MELTIHIEGTQITLGGESLAEKLQALDDQLRLSQAHLQRLRRERKLIAKLDRLLSATRAAKRLPATNGKEARGQRPEVRTSTETHPKKPNLQTLNSRRPRGELQAAAIDYLRANGASQVRDVGKAIGLDPARASQALVAMMAAGRVRQVRRGVYELDPQGET